jgi:hypothetical protein
MAQLIAYCGLACSDCEAYKATQANDMEELERIAGRWAVQYGHSGMTANDVMCDGCTNEAGRHVGYASQCAVRACGVRHGVVNCAYCDEYGCETLTAFVSQVPPARETLERIRQSR